MPVEFRFEDLDLREEPAGAMPKGSDYTWPGCTKISFNCTQTANCSFDCCTDLCV